MGDESHMVSRIVAPPLVRSGVSDLWEMVYPKPAFVEMPKRWHPWYTLPEVMGLPNGTVPALVVTNVTFVSPSSSSTVSFQADIPHPLKLFIAVPSAVNDIPGKPAIVNVRVSATVAESATLPITYTETVPVPGHTWLSKCDEPPIIVISY